MARDNAIEITGFNDLKKILEQYPKKVEKRVAKVGLSKAASRLRTYARRAAPKQSGLLRRSLRIGRSRRYPAVWVYFRWPGPDNRESYFGQVEREQQFFKETLTRHRVEIMKIIEDEAINALYKEAGIAYAKSKRLK